MEKQTSTHTEEVIEELMLLHGQLFFESRESGPEVVPGVSAALRTIMARLRLYDATGEVRRRIIDRAPPDSILRRPGPPLVP